MSSLDLSALVLRRVVAAVEKALEDTAVLVQADARDEAPKDTQALANSIQAEKISPLSYKVTANTKYAVYVHEGHITKSGRFIAGIPFLTRPLSKHKQLLAQRIRENLS